MRIETLAVHAGYTPDPTTKAVAVPIYQTVAFAFDNTQHGADLFDLKVAGNIYSRIPRSTAAPTTCLPTPSHKWALKCALRITGTRLLLPS